MLSTLVLFSLFGTHSYVVTPEIGLIGHIKISDGNGIVKSGTVFVEGDNNFLNKSVTDKQGNFVLDFSDSNERAFDFYCSYEGSDTLLLASVKSFDSDRPEITFYIPKRVNALEKVVCPFCKKNDKLYRLIYSKLDHKQFTVSSMRYYCSRNKMKF